MYVGMMAFDHLGVIFERFLSGRDLFRSILLPNRESRAMTKRPKGTPGEIWTVWTCMHMIFDTTVLNTYIYI